MNLAQSHAGDCPKPCAQEKGWRENAADSAGADRSQGRDQFRQKQADQEYQAFDFLRIFSKQDTIGNEIAIAPNIRKLQGHDAYHQSADGQSYVNWDGEALKRLLRPV